MFNNLLHFYENNSNSAIEYQFCFHSIYEEVIQHFLYQKKSEAMGDDLIKLSRPRTIPFIINNVNWTVFL